MAELSRRLEGRGSYFYLLAASYRNSCPRQLLSVHQQEQPAYHSAPSLVSPAVSLSTLYVSGWSFRSIPLYPVTDLVCCLRTTIIQKLWDCFIYRQNYLYKLFFFYNKWFLLLNIYDKNGALRLYSHCHYLWLEMDKGGLCQLKVALHNTTSLVLVVVHIFLLRCWSVSGPS